MKTLMQYLLVAMFLFPFAPAQLKATEANVLITANNTMERNASEKATLARLKAIKLQTKSNLSKSEKKALRQEVLNIRDQHKGPSGVVYISTGALILIIVLLIILL
ncbi:MAG: hypothetical protein H0W73_15250 [Bacteroidetes bacterium]|nr:hypothetical protein [Bacteroidota bacterium]